MERADDCLATHLTNVEVSPSIPPDVEVATNIALRVTVSCPSGCDLRGGPVTVMAPNGVVMMSELATYADKVNETKDFAFKAPEEVGQHAWSIVFPRHETERCVHEESSLPISFRTKPHTTSLAVWAVPSPAVMNRSFKVNVGVKCSAMCQLTGHVIEIRNEVGTKIGEGQLVETPWPGTDSLYWTAVELVAPATEGVLSWTARFTATESALPHEETSAAFSFRTAKPPEHRLTIEIVTKDTRVPVEDVEVRFGPYEAFTDERGVAAIELPKGIYNLDIRKDGYTAQPITVEVSEAVAIQVEALTAPTKAEIEERMRRFEDYPWG